MGHLKRRWGEMGRGRRIILLIHPALFILSLVLCLTLGRQQVVSYGGGHLRYERQGERAVYSGRIDGYRVKYVVSPGPVVEYWLGGVLDSTYTVTEDPTAIPRTEDIARHDPDFFTGVEIRRGDEVWFRGAYSPYSSYWLLDEAGDSIAISITAVTESSKPEPTPNAILRFAQGPETPARGHPEFMLYGLLASAICLASLLFEDQLFRWDLSFRIRDPHGAEPSEWELFTRWVGWIIATGVAALAYALGSGLIYIS